jgi:hypothetical protein
VRIGRKTLRSMPVTKSLAAGEATTLRVRFKAGVLRRLRAALRAKKLTATVTAIAGGTSTTTLRVKLRA